MALSSQSILIYISKSIPAQDGKQAIKDPFAAISVHAHACMLAVGFKLVGLGEDHKIEAHSELTDTQPLPQEWDQHSSYAFRYTHSQSSMEFLLKVTRLGGKAIIFGVGLPDDKTAQVEVKAQDYISENSLKNSSTDDTESLKHCYISSGRIEDLAEIVKTGIIQKLIPGLTKEGYEETAARAEARDELREQREGPSRPARDPLRDDRLDPARPHPFDDPLADAPRRSRPVPDFLPPGFEDEHEIQRPGGRFQGGQPFGNIGDRDLYPPGLGPNDPLRIGPGGGGIRGGGGMHPTFDDPLFQGQGGQRGYDPRAPPGARYDPIGPGDGAPNIRGGRGFPGGSGGGPPNPFGGFGGGDFI